MHNETRRKFLTVCLGGIAAVAAGAVAWPVYRYLAPRTGEDQQGTVSIPEDQIPADSARFFDFRGSTAVAVRKKDGGLVVLSAICTHLGCIVQWEKERQDFLCPCHAGRYSPDGTVLSGPPPRPLPKLPFSVANGIITIG